MSFLEACWTSIASVIFLTAIALILYRILKTRQERKNNLVPESVREHSHEQANETTKLRSGLRRIANSPDPLAELVRSITGERHARDH